MHAHILIHILPSTIQRKVHDILKMVYDSALLKSFLDPCAQNNGGCDHNCTVVNSSKQCSCRLGYYLRTDGVTCEGKARKHYLLNYSSAKHC